MLTKIDNKNDKIAVRFDSISSIEACDDESTWIELNSGTKFLVSELAIDVLYAIGGKTLEVKETGL